MDIVKVSWSGGKDSTCAVSLHLKQNDLVKAVCYIPMFTDEIPLITKRHYEFINNTADFFRSQGAEVYFAKGITYFDFVTHFISKGKNKGKIFGFPTCVTGMCEFKNYSKVASLKKVDVGYFDYEDIGIAFDEYKRHSQLNNKKRSILVEKGYTEQFATMYCYHKGLLSPHYDYDKRDGCALCYNAPESRRIRWLNDYPEAKSLLIDLQNIVKENRPDRFPLRNHQWFIDTENPQLSIFD